jgi:hypothetical protein
MSNANRDNMDRKPGSAATRGNADRKPGSGSSKELNEKSNQIISTSQVFQPFETCIKYFIWILHLETMLGIYFETAE